MTSGKMTINDVIKSTTQRLKNAKIESANLDCRLLLCEYLGVDKLYLILNGDKEFEYTAEFEKLVERRVKYEPMQYILGRAEFMSMDFAVTKDVLIPRPDTEILVEKVIDFIGDKSLEFLDIGTGSGCIPISILANCHNCKGYSADVSKEALEIASKNAKSNGVEKRLNLLNLDILTDFPKLSVDCIVSNPPYIRKAEIPTLMADVAEYEPHLALDGGEDGLDFYRRIAKEGYGIIKSGGMIAFEIGYDQAEDLKNILKSNGYSNIEVTKDLAGLDRVVTAIKL